jgi:segregation and condensation protein A
MAINVKIDTFEGPLDLLLHLIRKAEVDIYDIPISEITEQYISYLKSMEEFDMDMASEFLVMAATLIEIKSKMLLPGKNSEDELAADEDPRRELVDKLIEYKKYKEFAHRLKDIETSNVVYFKDPEILDDIDNKEIFFKNITLDNLMFAFKKIVKSYENKFNDRAVIPENIQFDEYRIEEKMEIIKDLVSIKKSCAFNSFFSDVHSNMELIVIFLAMLELIKLKYIKAVQYKNFGDIFLEGQEDLWKIS